MRAEILVVDDDVDCRNLLETALGFEGFGVITARNGAEALAAAREHQPRLILLDLMMPVMDGYQFRAQQQADAEIADIPVICISGTHQAQRAARRLGAAGCIEKPIALEELIRTMRDLFAAE
jgi:CheY-like chemotaxis protein